MTRKRGPAGDIQRRDAGNGGKNHFDIVFLRIIRLQSGYPLQEDEEDEDEEPAVVREPDDDE